MLILTISFLIKHFHWKSLNHFAHKKSTGSSSKQQEVQSGCCNHTNWLSVCLHTLVRAYLTETDTPVQPIVFSEGWSRRFTPPCMQKGRLLSHLIFPHFVCVCVCIFGLIFSGKLGNCKINPDLWVKLKERSLLQLGNISRYKIIDCNSIL